MHLFNWAELWHTIGRIRQHDEAWQHSWTKQDRVPSDLTSSCIKLDPASGSPVHQSASYMSLSKCKPVL